MGRRKVTKPKSECTHNGGWAFKKVEDGVERTCRLCGKKIKEVGRQVHSTSTLHNTNQGWRTIKN
jgi:hypothetical protein